jgi:hypothetical protein
VVHTPPGPAYFGFVYQNLPAFVLSPGDTVAFDTGALNDIALSFDIAFAAATSNGSREQNAAGFQTIASGSPAAPFGDTVQGNYELAFSVASPFAFNGGGLIIRFLPTGASVDDRTSQQNLVYSHSSDLPAYFVGRFYLDEDGVYPWRDGDDEFVGNFQLQTSRSVPEPSSLAMLIVGGGGALGAHRFRRRSAPALGTQN